MNMQNQPNDLAQDIVALVEELGFDDMTQEEQEQAMADILQTVNLRTTMRISGMLTNEQNQRMDELTKENPEAAHKALLEMVPQEQQTKIFQEELQAVKEEIKREAGIG